MFELIAVLWLLSLADLIFTLWAHLFTHFQELNPIARALPLLKPDGRHVLIMPRPADYLRIGLPGRVRTVHGVGYALEVGP